MNLEYDPDKPLARYFYRREVGRYYVSVRTAGGWDTSKSLESLRFCSPERIWKLMEIKVRLGGPEPTVYIRDGKILTEEA